MGWTFEATLGEPLADIRAIAHITGGGLGKLVEALPENIAAYLDEMPVPPMALMKAQALSSYDSVPADLKLTDEQGYTTLNGGIGIAVVAANDTEADKLIKAVKPFGIEARVVGNTGFVSNNNQRLIVHSRYLFKTGQTIYPLKPAA